MTAGEGMAALRAPRASWRSPGSLAGRVACSLWFRFRNLRRRFLRSRDRWWSSYSEGGRIPPLERFVEGTGIPSPEAGRREVAWLSEEFLAHRFDLLGSGPVRVAHGVSCRGLEGRRYGMGAPVAPDRDGKWLEGRVSKANLGIARRTWRLVDEGYEPIDWHLDFRSGYRWSEMSWYTDLVIPPAEGADIKVPWELARMQHLPILALARKYAGEARDGFRDPSVYAREFRNQVLDFIAANPPRFGVNWHCAMDVGIRAANWLVAHDLFLAQGDGFDPGFEDAFRRSVYEHGRHILDNLEWHPALRTNHYLADIAGLLFIAAYLPRTKETDAWLAFSVRELVEEVKGQFFPEGSNFEASTGYHRLSAEMALFSTALVLGLGEGKREGLPGFDRRPDSREGTERPVPFPPWYIERLEAMAGFTADLTKPDGRIVQIGDNDSGRFLKIGSGYRISGGPEDRTDPRPIVEDFLDHRGLVREIASLFGGDDPGGDAGSWPPAAWLARALARGATLPSLRPRGEKGVAREVRVGDRGGFSGKLEEICARPGARTAEEEIPVPGSDLREGLALSAYPDFGVYIFRSNRVFLSIRCGAVGQNGAGGHAHNDQLSIELNIDGEDWITDPGSYLYTPLPAFRNAYRSVKAHSAPRLGDGEPGRLDLGLFRLGAGGEGRCVYFREDGFIGTHAGYGIPVFRSVAVRDRSIAVKDVFPGAPEGAVAETGLRGFRESAPPFSPGYGLRRRDRR